LIRFRAFPDVTSSSETYAAVDMRNTMNGLTKSVVTVGLAVAVFLAITMSVQFSLATAAPSEAPSHPTPVPSYRVSQIQP
jgi:hypothetical protein